METSFWKRGTLVLCYDLHITHHTYVTCSTVSEIRKALLKIKQLPKLPLLQQSSAKPQPSQEILFPFGSWSCTNKDGPDAKYSVDLVLGTNEGISRRKYGLLESLSIPSSKK